MNNPPAYHRLPLGLLLGAASRCPVQWTASFPMPTKEWHWQEVFPPRNRWKSTKTGEDGRHHIDESLVQKGVKDASVREEMTRRAPCDPFRHSAATH
jgi:hypothetical protein